MNGNFVKPLLQGGMSQQMFYLKENTKFYHGIK